MERRNSIQEGHPVVSDFACPSCAGMNVRLATVAEQFFYLRCDACAHIWSHPERRQMQRRRLLPNEPEPLNATLAPPQTQRRKA